MAKCTKDITEITKKCTVLLLDIEGTTTSISFVKDKLFPYAVENVEKFLESHWDEEDTKKAVTDLRKQAADDIENKVVDAVPVPAEDSSKDDQIAGLVKNVKWQISADRKAGPLKFLQGLIWKQGYESGDIKGHVYEDVAPALKQWRSVDDKKVYIYSSGSVQAQKLIFGQSEAGDLTKHINGYFDTEVGAKQEANSYKNIVEKIGVKAEAILFLTDIPKEATAATAAGLQSALLDRPGNAILADDDKLAFPVLTSLAELVHSQKRKPDEQEDVQPAKVAKTEAESDVKREADIAETSPTKVVEDETPAPKKTEKTPTEKVESMEVSETPVEEEVIKTADAKTDNDKEKDQDSMETDSAVMGVEIKEVSDSDKVAEEVVNVTPIVEEPVSEDVKVVETDKVENKGEEKADVVPEKVDVCKTDKDVEMQEEISSPAIVIEEVKMEDKPSCSVIDKLDITDAEPLVEEPIEECVPETKEYIDLLRTERWPVPVEEDQEAECDEIMAKTDDILTDVADSKVKNVEKEPPAESSAEVKEGKLETEKVKEAKLEAEKVKEAKLEAEKVKEAKLEAEKVTEAKLEAEKVKEAKLEAEKVKEAKLEAEKVKEAKLEAEKVKEAKLEAEKLKEAKLEAEKVKEAKLEAEKVKEAKLEAEKVKQAKLEAEKVKQAKLEAEKVKQAKLEAEKVKEAKLEAEKVKKAKLEAEKVKKAKLEAEKVKEAKLEAEKIKEAKLEAEKVKKAKLEAEKVKEAKLEAEKVKEAKLEAEKVKEAKLEEKVKEAKLEAEKVKEVKLETEKVKKAKLETDKVEEVKTGAQILEVTKAKTAIESTIEEKVIAMKNQDVEIAEVIVEKEVKSKVETNVITKKNKEDGLVEKAEEPTEKKVDRKKILTPNEKDVEMTEETKNVEIATEKTEKDPTPPIPEPNGEKMDVDEKVAEEIESPVDVVKENGSNESETTKESVENRLETNGVGKPLNGDSATKSLNGDTQVNGEEMESRVSEEGHEKEERLNGTNGAKTATEESMETEVAEIKVKSIPVEETAVPIEQAMET